jgi:hypothetical protein
VAFPQSTTSTFSPKAVAKSFAYSSLMLESPTMMFATRSVKDIKPAFMKRGGMNLTGNVPVIDLNGQIMAQSYAILRHFSRILWNQYDGDAEEEMFWVDRMCDITVDCGRKVCGGVFFQEAKRTISEALLDEPADVLACHGNALDGESIRAERAICDWAEVYVCGYGHVKIANCPRYWC